MLYPRDEMAFGLENLAVSPEEMPGRIELALDTSGLNKKDRETRIDQLSGGQQQRLTFASILSQGSQFLLLDEPTANLDPHGRRALVGAVTHEANLGKGVLVVEHNLEPWFPLINRVLLLSPEGELIADGAPEDLFRKWSSYLEDNGIWKPKAVKASEALESLGYSCSPLPLNLKSLKSMDIPQDLMEKAVNDSLSKSFGEIARPASRAAAELINVSALYSKGKNVLQDIDLSIVEGDFMALVGLNGSGKSTLARTLIGMLKPQSGSIKLFGEEVNYKRPASIFKRVGYVFQNPEHQFVSDTVWGELEYSASQLKLDPKACKDKIKEMLSFFGLEKLYASNPFTLSGGQKRRLSVATMLMEGKELLILDEPTFGQDQRSAGRLMDRIAELNRSGVTVLMITHDLELVDMYAKSAAVMNEGGLIFKGTPDELWLREDIVTDSGLELPFRISAVEHPLERRNENAVDN
jgi:energy-coupling factor transport system ATP-binding protein